MILSVVIPCYNSASTIEALLESMAKQKLDKPWEVIVSDNGSSDNTVEIARKYEALIRNLRIVDSSDRRGAAHARNIGVSVARGESIVFCDSDDQVADGWLAAMAKALERNDLVASRFDTTKLNPQWVRAAYGNPQQSGPQPYIEPPFLTHAGGSGLGVRRELHVAIGGFDESWDYLEDTDYCWRLQLRGTRLVFEPDAVLYCRCKDSLRGLYRQLYNWGMYNVRLCKKYREFGMPAPRKWLGVKAWLRLVKSTMRISNRETLAVWVRNVGLRAGRLRGSIKYSIFAL